MTSKSKSKKKYYEPKPAFVERMQQLLPNENDFQEYIKILEVELPRSIRCNTLKISPEKLKSRLEKNYNWIIKQPFEDFPEIMIVEGKLLANTTIKNNDNKEKQTHKSFSDINNSSVKVLDKVRTEANDNANLFALAISPEAIRNRRSVFRGSSKETSGFLLPGELGRSLEHMLGYYYIQEIASMLPVLALDPKPNETILDLCASPGSKTTQIASRMQNTGTLIANEVSQGRINILSANLSRCGCTNVIITKKDGMVLCKKLESNISITQEDISKTMNIANKTMSRAKNKNQDINNQAGDEDSGGVGTFSQTKKQNFLFDKILVDAPCSGEGTIRSTPATNKMWNPKTITRLSKIQKNLVASALKILKPGGTLIYSTCTHAPEENEAILDYIKKEFDVEIEPVAASLPKELKCREGITEWEDVSNPDKQLNNDKGGTQEGGHLTKKFSPQVKNACRIYPQDNNTEGFFISMLKKN